MFDKLHLLSQDVPEGSEGLRWRAHPYLRMAGAVARGPAVFDWNDRQRADLEQLWRAPMTEGARERLASDLTAFCDRLGWAPDAALLEAAEQRGEEYIVTLSAVPPELYLLPWEVIQVGAERTYLSDFASAQVRYAMPGLEPRAIEPAPAVPGVLFAWSAAGGAVPHDEQAAAIRSAAEASGAVFRELAEVDEAGLRAALEAGPPSVLHLLCHGAPGAPGEPSRLTWGPSDAPSQITATRLTRMLRPHAGAIRLVVLSACGSGDGRGDPLWMGSLAQELHRRSIRNVVASRYPLSVCGSVVMTRALYDKLLREAWSLERSLRHTRDVLLHVADHGETHPGDAYGIQLYAHEIERFISDNAVEAERPVLASYPFGTPARPVPASGPPAAELTLAMDRDPDLPEDALIDRLRAVTEDEHLTVAIPLRSGAGGHPLIVHTTVDGAQRLLGAWRSKALQIAIGVIVGELVVSNLAQPVLHGALSAAGKLGGAAGKLLARGKASTAAGKAGGLAARSKAGTAAGKVAAAAARTKAATAATRVGSAAGQVGTAAGKVGAVAGQVTTVAGRTAAAAGRISAVAGRAAAAASRMTTAAGQAAIASAGKVAVTAAAIASRAAAAKLAVAAVVTSVAAGGGAVVYTARARSAPVEIRALTDPGGAAPGPAMRSPGARPAPAVAAIVPVDTRAPTVSEPAIAPAMPRTAASGRAEPDRSEPARAAVVAARPAAARSDPDLAGPPPPAIEPAGPGRPAAPPPAMAPAGPGAAGLAAPPPAIAPVGQVMPSAAAPPDATGVAPPSAAPSIASSVTTDPAAQPTAAPQSPAAPPAAAALPEPARDPEPPALVPAPRSPVAAAPPLSIDPSALQAHQISGNSNVAASPRIRAAMAQDQVTSLRAVVRLCIDPTGLVSDSAMVERTGYTEYDSKLVEIVREWRYRPYLVRGRPVVACSTVEFIYQPGS